MDDNVVQDVEGLFDNTPPEHHTRKVYCPLNQEVVKPSQRFLLYDTRSGGFRVTCSRALLNSLLQRAEFNKNVELDMSPAQLEHTFAVLQLDNHFKLDQMDQWLDSKGKLLSSILAISKILWSRGVSLSPVDDVTYTSLVERPCGYICSIEEGWVVLRAVSDQWYLLDPRSANITPLSDTHLHMIIKQLLLENEPIFRVSGKGLSTVEGNATQTESAGSEERRAVPEPPDPGHRYLEPRVEGMATQTESAGSVECRADPEPPDPGHRYLEPRVEGMATQTESAGSVERRADPEPPDPGHRYLEPRVEGMATQTESAGSVERRAAHNPPDPGHRYLEPRVLDPHRERRGEVMRMLTDLTRLRMSPQRSPSIKPETQERSRSVTRDQVLWRSASQRGPVTESRLVLDPEWPPLGQDTRPTRRRRARSSPRSSRPPEPQRYHPPRGTDGAGKSEEKRWTGGGRKTGGVAERSVCCICLEAEPDHALYPCGHQCLCLHCKTVFLTKFRKCPICNKYVTDAIKIFRA